MFQSERQSTAFYNKNVLMFFLIFHKNMCCGTHSYLNIYLNTPFIQCSVKETAIFLEDILTFHSNNLLLETWNMI